MISQHAIVDAGPEDFDRLVFDARGVLVIVDFWGPGCPNCEVFARDAPALLATLPTDKVRVVKVNAYEHPELARRFALFGIPTFLLVKDGKRLGKMSEYYGRDYFLGVIRDHLPTASQKEA
jgi:thioredoxin 1